MQIIDYKFQPNENYQNVKKKIERNAVYPVKNIRILPHPEIYFKNLSNIFNGEINPSLEISSIIGSCDFIVAELYEN